MVLGIPGIIIGLALFFWWRKNEKTWQRAIAGFAGIWAIGSTLLVILALLSRVSPNGSDVQAVEYFKRGVDYQERGQLDLAIEEFTKAIDLDPQNAITYTNRGAVYSMKDDLDRAIADFDQAIALDPQNADVYNSRSIAGAVCERPYRLRVLWADLTPWLPLASLLLLGRGSLPGFFSRSFQGLPSS